MRKKSHSPPLPLKMRYRHWGIHTDNGVKELHTFSFSDDENKLPSPKEVRIEIGDMLHLDSNPLKWHVTDVVEFIRHNDCSPLARTFLDQEIDGKSLLLLTLARVCRLKIWP